MAVWVSLFVALAVGSECLESRKLEEKDVEEVKKPEWFFDGNS